MQALLALLDLLQLVATQLGLLQLHLALEELVQDLHTVDWLVCAPALGFVSPPMRKDIGLLRGGGLYKQLLLREYFEFLSVDLPIFQLQCQVLLLLDELGLNVAVHNFHDDLSLHPQNLHIV